MKITNLALLISDIGMQRRSAKKSDTVPSVGFSDVLFRKVEQRVRGVLFGNPNRSF